MIAPDSTSTEQVPSENIPGVMYDYITEVYNDGCSYCSATGKQQFATQEDWDALAQSDDEDAELQYSGVKPCEYCNGTCRIPGAGPLLKFTLSFKGSLQMLPPDL